ncbi:uncharacterized protein LY79DRAFT_591007 [Colletotrichum navitas]|uniref:Uncharacterized protein n=1 Tax=Colletotrichum navitas TaxID=681940 RepID=A0AAD8PXG9_9PEZI|nr:uncharacterized protein LY79DRAFT_591007 [Colletotrichum navitas]KAK1589731.1 hypothetical protein LY79DRAFT_591007 [Colletotrichum navitas]
MACDDGLASDSQLSELLTLQEGNLWHPGNTGRHLSRTARPFLTCLFGHDASCTACGQIHGHVTRRKPAWPRVTWTNDNFATLRQRRFGGSTPVSAGPENEENKIRMTKKEKEKERKTNQGVGFCAYS